MHTHTIFFNLLWLVRKQLMKKPHDEIITNINLHLIWHVRKQVMNKPHYEVMNFRAIELKLFDSDVWLVRRKHREKMSPIICEPPDYFWTLIQESEFDSFEATIWSGRLLSLSYNRFVWLPYVYHWLVSPSTSHLILAMTGKRLNAIAWKLV
jgi:hypothetical protein